MKIYIAIATILVIIGTMMMMTIADAKEDLEVGISKETIHKYYKLVKKFGVKAEHFLACMGEDWCKHCVGPTINCLAAKNVKGCISVIACEGKSTSKCVHHL
ncbi:uncharacterized protein LOC124498245 [Dermatophagoides farinae]|uniref:Uncharacterized protein n=1 Tax=Dermatophagoides farinae TaxID=6954 RepID=A0A922ICR1_DERFA|nr:uncharacterized protein LOC124498245 [Dermatophagoides farinae]KAH7636581.1 hypothetical protein HUG17_10551 [Dermatophagoides farinae]KAH9528680.1 hypothetical protein DERF_002600 [Dermatophagoides farinae]